MTEDQDLFNDDLYGGKALPMGSRRVLSRGANFIALRPTHSPKRSHRIDADQSDASDLDEDLDATQLEEELVDPPDLEPQYPATAQQPSAPQPAQSAVGSSSTQSAAYQGQDDNGNFGFGDGSSGLTGVDRIRPSDMPDEGLVGFSSPGYTRIGSRFAWPG